MLNERDCGCSPFLFEAPNISSLMINTFWFWVDRQKEYSSPFLFEVVSHPSW